MLFDSFVPLIMSQVLGCEVFQVLDTNIERNKWLSILVSQVGGDLKLWGPQVVRADCNYIRCISLLYTPCGHLFPVSICCEPIWFCLLGKRIVLSAFPALAVVE